MHGPGRKRAGDLAARHEPNAEDVGALSRSGDTAETVMVGQRHRGATCGYCQLHDPFWSLRAVGAGRVQMQVDHRAERTGGGLRTG